MSEVAQKVKSIIRKNDVLRMVHLQNNLSLIKKFLFKARKMYFTT